jgi:sugar-specific transcriptional regulator TrmB
MFEKILKDIGLSETASQIYLRLAETGYASARQLAENLNLPRPTIYDNLKWLIIAGLVIEKEEGSKKLFGIDDTKNLLHFVQSKIDDLTSNEKKIKELLPSLPSNISSLDPKIKFYPGVEGMKQVLKDMLWYKNIETTTMWPISEMVEILGDEYLANLNRRRIRQGISIKGIWPSDKKVDFKKCPYLGVGKAHLRELRLAPKEMSWNMSYWQYADKVAFISSKAECFGFVIHSKDFVNLIKAQFEVIWKLSKPIKAQPEYTDSFLKTV